MRSIRVAAPAKLNLFLHIVGKRADGYHLLESMVAFPAFGDWLDISPSDALELTLTGEFAGGLQGESDNLVLRAARSLQSYAGVAMGAHIILHKRLPVGAGVGGGSADAAAALRGLMRLWGVTVPAAELHRMALRLGSDVPVCLDSQAAWMGGIGEDIRPLDMNLSAWMVLANQGKPLWTADVFRRFSAGFAAPCALPGPLDSLDSLIRYLKNTSNMLEAPARALMPEIETLLASLAATKGCELARMSGSGATCFGLYGAEKEANEAVAQLQLLHPAWWFVASPMRSRQEEMYETQ